MFSRKSIVLTTLALILALPVAAYAQTSRVEGMALQGDYIKDYTGMFTYVSGITSVGNLVYAELGNGLGATPTDRGVGAVLGNLWDGRFGTWGIALRATTPQLGQGDTTGTPGPEGTTGINNDPNVNANQSFDLMWGKKMGTMNLGLHLSRSFRKDKTIDATPTTTIFEADNSAGNIDLRRNITGFGAGVGFEFTQNSNIELSGLVESRTFETSVTPPGTSDKDDGGLNYQIAGRMMWQWTPSCVVTPVLKFYSFDLSHKTTPPSANTDNTLSGWQAGAAGNWTVGTSDLFVLGATFASNKLETDENLFGFQGIFGAPNPQLKVTESITPQVFAALETHVNRWLTLRFGANKGAFQRVKVEGKGATAFTREISLSAFRMNLGAGVKVGTLQFDGVLDNNFAQNITRLGSDFASTIGKVSATYAF